MRSIELEQPAPEEQNTKDDQDRDDDNFYKAHCRFLGLKQLNHRQF
jgi:hypothetical protein